MRGRRGGEWMVEVGEWRRPPVPRLEGLEEREEEEVQEDGLTGSDRGVWSIATEWLCSPEHSAQRRKGGHSSIRPPPPPLAIPH